MTGADKTQPLRPHEKKHKQYLCILVLYTRYNMKEIVSLLNRKFSKSMSDHERFDADMTKTYWEYMERTNHRELQWARNQVPGSWRIQRVLKWVEEQEIR